MTHILTTAAHGLAHLGHTLAELLGSALVQWGLGVMVSWWAGR